MKVPFWRRFRLDFEHNGRRFYFRICFGLVVIYVARRWQEYSAFQFASMLQIGYIPLKLEEGQTIPAWTVFRKTTYIPMGRL